MQNTLASSSICSPRPVPWAQTPTIRRATLSQWTAQLIDAERPPSASEPDGSSFITPPNYQTYTPASLCSPATDCQDTLSPEDDEDADAEADDEAVLSDGETTWAAGPTPVSLQQYNSDYEAHIRDLYSGFSEAPPPELVRGLVSVVGDDGRPQSIEVPLGVRSPDFVSSDLEPAHCPPTPVSPPPSTRVLRPRPVGSGRNSSSPGSSGRPRPADPSTAPPSKRRRRI
ncbi:hypothetical protein EVG20_g826 [Dentipellis fragilis]|uniref:Uncharacterized protein n=1 Tax=Dentipellis fragilis TaxID=205917 RepID=A0A4Y9ZEC2_9AGAM|nr:hypothetical protein EVG20_g826 [Dentipellis fragilis]